MVLAALYIAFARAPHAPSDDKHVVQIRDHIALCKQDQKSCLGGFVKFKDRKDILQLRRCPNRQYCNFDEYDVQNLTSLGDHLLSDIEYVVIRKEDPARWEQVALQYVGQFTRD
jgi:hypothetical protein